MQVTCAQLARHCDSNIASAAYVLNKFQEAFAKDPAYAFAWSDAAVAASATSEVNRQIKAWLDQDTDKTDAEVLAAITGHVSYRLLHRAGSPASSTSSASNAVETGRTVALAKLASYLMRGF